jgi:citronellol/citronellal dehydrogenase
MPDANAVLHPDLHGRVAIVTGASRGIGKALAIRLAREGADVTVAAKSEESTERLPGSIHETADAIRALGRQALAIATDVRNEDAIRTMIERTIAEFGRLDILVNNAGVIWAQPILQTPPKRFDLMIDVNVRAAYVACYYALPQMVKQQWGHVLNMCPRLSGEPSPGRVAYMISKLGMTRVAIGVAAEHRQDNIAGNSLWPRTIIESQASINWKMADRSQWRTPEIVLRCVTGHPGRGAAELHRTTVDRRGGAL